MQRYYTLRPSRALALLTFLLVLVALVLVWLLPLPTSVSTVLAGGILCWGGYSLFLGANLRLQHSCVAFRLEEREEVVLVLRNGKHLPGRLLSDSLVVPYFIILNVALSEQRGRRSLVILSDAMNVDSLRRLRVALKWGGSGQEQYRKAA